MSDENFGLVKYDAARMAIAEARAVDEVKSLRDKAVALKLYARQAKNKQLEVDAADIRWRAERRLGEMINHQAETVGLATGGQPYQNPTGSVSAPVERPPTLAEAGIDKKLSSRARAIASIPEEEFEAELAQHREEQAAVTLGTMERLAGRAHVANNSGNNEWYTPPSIIEMARAAMGGIDLDPASSLKANQTVGAPVIYTAGDDGLSKEWSGRVWMNPPYSQPLIGKFVQKLIESELDAACVLVNNGTETTWGQTLLSSCDAVCFPRSRIKFIDPEGNPSGAPLQGQMIIYIGPNETKFAREFSELGIVLFGV